MFARCCPAVSIRERREEKRREREGGRETRETREEGLAATAGEQGEERRSMRVLVSVSVHRLTAVLTGTMLGCILTTYSLCIHESHCPRFLPMISDSEWEWEREGEGRGRAGERGRGEEPNGRC